VILLCGPAGAGKSTVCARVVELARQAGLRVAGVISPPQIAPGAEGQKTSIWVEDVLTGERRLLAVAAHLRQGLVQTKHWTFNAETLGWGSDVIARAVPCDLLVVDELGPLELERGEGWTVALEVLRGRAYQWALVVVRPELIAVMRARLEGMAVRAVVVSQENRDALPEQIAGWLWSDEIKE
jgi:nucleoside-triphosphatase THEP1